MPRAPANPATEQLPQHVPAVDAATERRAQNLQQNVATERQAQDGVSYTYQEFVQWYGTAADEQWAAAAADPQLNESAALATEQPLEPRLYVDYNDVLNSGSIEEMSQFVIRLDQLHVSLHLLSRRRGKSGMEQTLSELDDAEVLDLFDTITFTAFRTAKEREASATERASRLSSAAENAPLGSTHHDFPGRHLVMDYTSFYGGKDEYIHLHDNGALTLFVDDKYDTIKAVRQLVPHVQGYEFRRHCFFSPIAACSHVRNLSQLFAAISAMLQSMPQQ